MACGRQTYRQTVFFLLMLKALGTLDRHPHHLSYQGGPKSPLHIFFVLTNLDCFDLGTSLKKLCLSHGSDVAYIGNWPRAMYRFLDKQTDSLTDRQTGRHAYIFCWCLRSQTSFHCLSMDCLQTVSELYIYSLFYVGMIMFHFLWGEGD